MAEQSRRPAESVGRSAPHSEPDIHPILTASPYLYVAVDRDGVFRGMNAAAEAFFGHRGEELLGRRRLTRFLHPDDRAKAATAITAAPEGSHEAVTLRVRWPRGHLRILECRFDWDEESGLVLAWARDATEDRAVREELQARIELLQDLLGKRERDLAELETFGGRDPLFRRIPLGVLRVDHEFRIRAANPKACRILGAANEEDLVGRTLGEELFAFEEDLQRLRSSLRKGEHLRGFLGHLGGSDGMWVQARFDANPVGDAFDSTSWELYIQPRAGGPASLRRPRPPLRTPPRPRWASQPGTLEASDS